MFIEVAVVVIGAIVLHHLITRFSQESNLPPGPRPLPLIGNLFDVITSMPYVHEAFCKLQKKYGDVFTLYLQGKRIIVINSASAAREALLARKNDFAGRPYVFGGDYVTRNSKDIVFGDYSQRLKLLRKIGVKAMREFIPQAQSTIIPELKELIARMKEHETKHVDLKNDVQLTIMNVVCALIFGQRYDIKDPEFLNCIYFTETACQIAESTGILGMFPWLIHFPIKPSNEIKKCCRIKDEILNRKYRQHLQTYDANVTRDLTDSLIKVRLEEEKSDVTKADVIEEDHVIMTMQDMFIAGNETSTTTILWALVHLMAHPHIQAKARAQIDDVIGHDRLPELSDRERLPFVEAIIAETSRLSSVVPLSIPHKTTTDTCLKKYTIPRDTTVLLNLWAIHHDRREWDDPKEFKPERFLDVDGKMKDVTRLSYMPWSTGLRNCMGEALAKHMMFLVITGMLQEFEFVSPTGAAIKNIKGMDGIVRNPENFKVSLKRRVKPT